MLIKSPTHFGKKARGNSSPEVGMLLQKMLTGKFEFCPKAIGFWGFLQ
jgi:hypothetical protein